MPRSSPSERRILYGPSGRLPWLIAALLLAVLLTVAVLLARAFHDAETREIDRYVDSIATHVESDLLDQAVQQAAIQGRMARRLAFVGSFGEAAWRADARRLMQDHAFYELMAVLDGDFGVRWLEGVPALAIAPGSTFPLGLQARERLAERAPAMAAVALEPFALPDGRPALLFMTPVVDGGAVGGWLAAVMDLRESLRAMLTGLYLQDVRMTIEFGDRRFALQTGDSRAEASPDFARGIVFELGDGVSELRLGVALHASRVADMRSGVSGMILGFGSLLAVLVAVASLLAMAAARQARIVSESNRSLKNEIHDRELAERELEFLLTHDSLTDLPNRQGMLRHIERVIQDFDERHSLAVFFIDLDQFKDVNETLGHHLGDELLRQVPERLSRELDDRDRLGRLGGDEYLVVAERAERTRITRLADNLLRCLEMPFRIGEHQLFMTASIGVAFYSSATTSPGELIQNADAAVFRAKQLGRNQHATFTPEMFAQVEYRLNLSRDIRQALDEGEFQVVYQPVVDLTTLDVHGVEALMRWPHRDGYNIPPRDFIRVAEETGVVQRLSRYALDHAVRDLAEWRRRFERAPWLAVNISGAQFRESEFVRDISVLLHHHRIEPSAVHLEITEEVLIENLARNRKVLEQLDEIGMPLVVDDFGIGYSSLAYIKNFPVSTIKIDQGFIRGLEDDREDQAITRTICDLSRQLGLRTIAEGIEQSGQLALLRDYGCQLGQGFLFMQPVSADEIARLLSGEPPWKSAAGAGEGAQPASRIGE
jgi:diguanylate cyclase (GGDEF)-like protein